MYTSEFPLDDSVCYLNHAAVAPWPTRTSQAVQAFSSENSRLGSRHYERWLAVEASLREQLRFLINASGVDEIALLKNTSEALSVVAHGIEWQPGDEVIISNLEFPSNRIVWESLSRYGVIVRVADLSSNPVPEQAVTACITAKTRLISISSVQYGTGLKLDLPIIGKVCRDKGILFCVDAIQSIGADPFDVELNYADFVMADGHKWMLGPEGLALFYCRRSRIDELKLHQYGWHMVQDPGNFDNDDWSPSSTATRFECGSPNLLGAHALHASLSLLIEVGIPQIAIEIRRKTDAILDYILASPTRYALLSPSAPERRAGIVTFRPLDADIDELYARLQGIGVVCAKRAGGIRFSPHFYTPLPVIERALKQL